MSVSAGNKNHYGAIAYTATFLGILLVLFLFVVFFTSSKPAQQVNQGTQHQVTSEMQ